VPHSREDPARYRSKIIESIGDTADICRSRGDIHLGLYDAKVIWRLLIVDDALFLGTYPPDDLDLGSGERACIVKIRRNAGPASDQLYLAFERYFDDLWRRFDESDDLKLALCRACRADAEEAKVRELADEYSERAAKKLGGCNGCRCLRTP
jgi:hypothetical protein